MPPIQSFSEKHKTRKHKCRAAAPPHRRAAALSESIDTLRSDIIRLK